MNLRFESDFCGTTLFSGAYATIYNITPGHSGMLKVVAGTVASQYKVTLTGWYLEANNGQFFYQLTSGQYISLQDDWKLGDKNTGRYSPSEAQKIINGILSNNAYILENNLLCARYSQHLTAEQRTILGELNTRLRVRNEALNEPEMLNGIRTGYPAGFANLGNYLTTYTPNIGVVITSSAVIITAAIVIAAMATAAYFAYVAYFKESEADVKFSKELTKSLVSKLTPKEYEQLMRETNGIVTRERIRQQLNMFGGLGKNLLLLIAGAFIVLRAPKWIDSVQKKPVSNTKQIKG